MMSDNLISKKHILIGSAWLKENFGEILAARLKNTSYDINIACAIACQETLYYWYSLMGKYDTDFILSRCILDASGDFDSSRKSFPQNTAIFRDAYGDDITEMLIKEANQSRLLRNMGPEKWVYKGYGIFQSDLQNIQWNKDFFIKKQWYSMNECISMLIKELQEKEKKHSTLKGIIKAYNGAGPDAEVYANYVMTYYEYINS